MASVSSAPQRTADGRPVLWKPYAGFQTRFCASSAFETLGGGAAGPGKTACLIAQGAQAMQHPNARGIFCRTIYKDLIDVRDRMQVLYPSLGAQWDATNTRWIFPSGAPLRLAHAASMNELSPFLGPEYTWVGWDELSLLKDETPWQMLLTRLRSTDPTVPLRARATANPVGPGKPWITERFVAKCGGEAGGIVYRDAESGRTRAYVPGTSKDNPALPSDYWTGLADLPESIQVALRDGKWFSALGLFYPELAEDMDRLFVTRAQLPPLLDWHEYWGAFDWGYVHPASYGQFVRVKDTVYWLDTTYMHRYQDEEQAAMIRGTSDPRCLRTVYAGHDAFAQRMAHSAAAETVADVFGRYGIALARANIDRAAGAKVLRRLFAPPKPGPVLKDTLMLRIVDTPGNRRALQEAASLVPEDANPNVPAKRDADEKGRNGDDGIDMARYGLATPTYAPQEPPLLWQGGNVETGKDVAPWEQPASFRLTGDGTIDKREFVLVGQGPTHGLRGSVGVQDPDLDQFPEGG